MIGEEKPLGLTVFESQGADYFPSEFTLFPFLFSPNPLMVI